MVSVLLLIMFMVTVLLFLPTKSDIVYQLRKKRRLRNDIAEFDLSTEENKPIETKNIVNKISGKLETALGRGYELLGHKMSDIGSQLEQNKNSLAERATNIYAGPLADKTGNAFENFQYGYGKMGDQMSTILDWLGRNVIKLGNNTGSMIRTSFRTIGDLIGDTVDKTEQFVGNGLIKSGEKVHIAAIDLQQTSHNDGENVRHKIQETAPEFEESVNKVLGTLGENIHTLGLDTEAVGEVIEQHQFLDTIKQANLFHINNKNEKSMAKK